MHRWDKESQSTWFARLWHRWQRWWLCSSYANTVRLRTVFHYCTHMSILFSNFLFAIRGASWAFDCLRDAFIRWKRKQSTNSTEKLVFQLHIGFTYGIHMRLSTFTALSREISASMIFNTQRTFQYIRWESFAFIFSDKPKYFRHLTKYFHSNRHYRISNRIFHFDKWNHHNDPDHKVNVYLRQVASTCQKFSMQAIKQFAARQSIIICLKQF